MATIRIFRLTNPGDNQNTDFIDFNVPNSKTTVENAFITNYKSNPSDGVGNNQGAEQELGDQQALGPVENILKISGFISKRNGDNDDGMNSYLVQMKEWETDPKINDNWDLGRFGFIDNDDHTEDVIPVNTGTDRFALLWERIEWSTDMKGNRKLFDLYLRLNRGDGT